MLGDAVCQPTWHPDGGSLLAVPGRGGEVVLYERLSWRQLSALQTGLSGEAALLAFSPNGLYLAAAGDDCGVALLRVEDGEALARRILPGKATALAWQPGSNALLVATEDGGVALWRSPVPEDQPGPHEILDLDAVAGTGGLSWGLRGVSSVDACPGGEREGGRGHVLERDARGTLQPPYGGVAAGALQTSLARHPRLTPHCCAGLGGAGAQDAGDASGSGSEADSGERPGGLRAASRFPWRRPFWWSASDSARVSFDPVQFSVAAPSTPPPPPFHGPPRWAPQEAMGRGDGAGPGAAAAGAAVPASLPPRGSPRSSRGPPPPTRTGGATSASTRSARWSCDGTPDPAPVRWRPRSTTPPCTAAGCPPSQTTWASPWDTWGPRCGALLPHPARQQNRPLPGPVAIARAVRDPGVAGAGGQLPAPMQGSGDRIAAFEQRISRPHPPVRQGVALATPSGEGAAASVSFRPFDSWGANADW